MSVADFRGDGGGFESDSSTEAGLHRSGQRRLGTGGLGRVSHKKSVLWSLQFRRRTLCLDQRPTGRL